MLLAGAQSSGGNETVDVGVVLQRGGPGMEYGHDGQGSTDVARVAAQLEERLGGGFDEQGVYLALVAAGQGPQFPGQGKHKVEVGDIEELLAAFLEPRFGLAGVAFGASAVAAGVISESLQATVVADKDVPAHGRGLAGHDVLHGPAVARQHGVAKAGDVLRPVAGEDVG